jgi:hypothetical protein
VLREALSMALYNLSRRKLRTGLTLLGIIVGIGAVVASALLYGVAIGKSGYLLSVNGLGQNGYDSASPGGFSMISGFIAEVVLTFIFLLVIHGSTSDRAPKGFAGIAIGLSLVLIHLVGIPVTGTSVNPALGVPQFHERKSLDVAEEFLTPKRYVPGVSNKGAGRTTTKLAFVVPPLFAKIVESLLCTSHFL